jgi:predicted RNA polymerase sigma factor
MPIASSRSFASAIDAVYTADRGRKPIISLNRAVVAPAEGPAPALAIIDSLVGELEDYHLLRRICRAALD